MRKLLSHPLIFVISILLVWGILFSGAKKVNGFSWFGLWTQQKNEVTTHNIFVQKSVMDGVITDTLQAHSILARGVSTLWSKAGSDTIPGYLEATQQLLMTDIIAYLENASDRAWALDSLIGQLQYYQNYGNQYIQQLDEVIGTATAEYTLCTNAKTTADSIFYQGLREWDQNLLQQWLTDSQTNAACQGSKRVFVNAHKAMLARIQYNVNVIANLLQVLILNRETILGNFMLFKDAYLEKLITVRDQLRLASPWTNN